MLCDVSDRHSEGMTRSWPKIVAWGSVSVVGLLLASLGVFFVRTGVTNADKWASTLGIFVGIIGLLLSTYSTWLTRRSLTYSRASPSVQSAWIDANRAGFLASPIGRLPAHVRGRDQIVREMSRLLRRPDGFTHVISGMGGTGKTTVALKLAETALKQNRAAWWISAGDSGGMRAELLDLARNLGATPDEIMAANQGITRPSDTLWKYLPVQRRWSLFLDNLDDLRDLEEGDGRNIGSGSGWIRPTKSGNVIVTSRNSRPSDWGNHAKVHEIRWLDPSFGAMLLRDQAPDAGTLDDAKALSQRLGGLPLALHHAGSYLASGLASEQSFTQYSSALEERFPEFMSQGRDSRSIVMMTWEVSLDLLHHRGHELARPILRILICGGTPGQRGSVGCFLSFLPFVAAVWAQWTAAGVRVERPQRSEDERTLTPARTAACWRGRDGRRGWARS
jgi:hypothetical protein